MAWLTFKPASLCGVAGQSACLLETAFVLLVFGLFFEVHGFIRHWASFWTLLSRLVIPNPWDAGVIGFKSLSGFSSLSDLLTWLSGD